VNLNLLAQFDSEAEAGASERARMRAAAAHLLVAKLQWQRNDLATTGVSLQRALDLLPGHPGLLLNLASLEVEQQKYAAALEHLRPLLHVPHYVFEAYRLQGWIHYQREEIEQAVAVWKRALAARRDPELEALLGQAEREGRTAARYQKRASGRFLLRYEDGDLASQRLAADIVDALHSMYDALASSFNVLPREPIVVLLYPNETFYELTGLPAWVHGLYDGKIRVPVRGLVSLTPPLEQVLRHELVHAFVFLKSRNRAPRWVQEGLAQYHARQAQPVVRQAFRSIFEPRAGRALAAIEAAFEGDGEQVRVAYAASLLVVEVLTERHGAGDTERFLEALAQGESMEQALRTAYRLSLVDLERAVYDTLR
jgi:tetratricopeptide (TPR) repeat protein